MKNNPLQVPTSLGGQGGFNRFLSKLKDQKFLQIMAIPGIIWMFIFCYMPMYGIIIAFKDYDIIRTVADSPWVGFEHFIEFFKDEKFALVMKNTIGISFWKLVVGFPLPIIFALFLNELRNLRFKRYVQTITYFPHFVSWVVLGGILMSWFEDTGMGTQLLVQFGILAEPTFVFAEPDYFWTMVVVTDTWKELGWSAIIYLAAIAGVDQEMYEAAIVDGAGRFKRMWYITLPCIKPTVAILFILSVSRLMNNNFDQIFVLKNSLNRSASDVLDIFVYRMGMETYRFSYAAAIGLFRSVVSLILLLVANFTTRKLTEDSLF